MDGSDLISIPALRVSPDDAKSRPNDAGHPSVRMLAHGSLEVRWFVPQPGELHLPHDRDEIYVVVSGTATFRRSLENGPFDEFKLGVLGEQFIDVAPGDVIFVPAGAWHRYEDTSPDFAVWAIFYGPEGGERP